MPVYDSTLPFNLIIVSVYDYTLPFNLIIVPVYDFTLLFTLPSHLIIIKHILIFLPVPSQLILQSNIPCQTPSSNVCPHLTRVTLLYQCYDADADEAASQLPCHDGGPCFWVGDNGSLSFYRAMEACTEGGGSLATPHNQELLDYVYANISEM